MTRLTANLWLLLMAGACTRPAELKFQVPAAAPSLTGLLAVKDCVVSVTREGQVQCLDDQGAARWKATVGHPVTLAPVLVADVVVIALGSSAHGLSQDDGREVWHLTNAAPRIALATDGAAAYSLSPDGGVTATGPGNELRWSAAARGGRLLVAGDGEVAVADAAEVTVLSANDGQKRWSQPAAGVTTLALGHGLVAAANATTGALVTLEAATGQPRWRANDARATGPLTMGSDTLWVATAHAVVSRSLDDGHLLRRIGLEAEVGAPVVESDGLLLVPLEGPDGCVAVVTARGTSAATRLCADHQLKGSPVVRGDLVLVGPRDGRVLGFRLNREKLGAAQP